MECLSLDFDVLETNNPKKLIVADTSPNWLGVEDLPAYLYITLPGSKKEKIFTFDKKAIQIFNSTNLGLSPIGDCEKDNYSDLPDGMYKIKMQSGIEDHFVEKYYLKTDMLELEISKKLVERALRYYSFEDGFYKCLQNIELNLKTAKAFTIDCDIKNAMKYYNEAVDEIDKL